MKNTQYSKFLGFFSYKTLKAMAEGGVGHSHLGKFLENVKREEKMRPKEEEVLPNPIKKFKGTPPPDSNKGKRKPIKRKGTAVKRKGVSTKGVKGELLTNPPKRRGRPKKG